MLITVLVLLLVALAPAAGGSYRALAALPWRGRGLLLGLLAAQVVLLQTPLVPLVAAPAVHVATYLLAGVFVVLNRHVRGLGLLAAGAASNALVITLNGGTMPASPAALLVAGADPGSGFTSSAAATGARLPWLGDVLAVPAGWPLANVFSVGDVLVVAGAAWVAWAGSRRPAPQAGQSPARSSSPGVCPAPSAPVTNRAGSARAVTSSPVSTPERPSA